MARYRIRTLLCCFVLYPTGAIAENATTDNDVRCLMIGLQLAQSDNQAARASGFASAMYYMGRLDGHDPRLDIEKALMGEIVKYSKEPSEQRRAIAVACGKQLQERGAAMSVIGNHIAERGKKMMQLENSR